VTMLKRSNLLASVRGLGRVLSSPRASKPPHEQEAERQRIEVLRRASQMLFSDPAIPEYLHPLLDAGG
jgi:hypothetical protein